MSENHITNGRTRIIQSLGILVIIILVAVSFGSIIQHIDNQIYADSITGNIEITVENNTSYKTIRFINECSEEVWFQASVEFANITLPDNITPKVGLYKSVSGESAEGKLYHIENNRGRPKYFKLLIEQKDDKFEGGNLTLKVEIYILKEVCFIKGIQYKVKENSIVIPI